MKELMRLAGRVLPVKALTTNPGLHFFLGFGSSPVTVPEPVSVVGLAAAVLTLGAGGNLRRKRRS